MQSKLGTSRKGNCPKCGDNKWATIVGHFEHSYEHDEAPMTINEEWFLLFCPACKKAYFASKPTYSQVVPVGDDEGDEAEYFWEGEAQQWPKPEKWKRPTWLPVLQTKSAQLHSLFLELFAALDEDLKVLAAIGMRTAFECTWGLLSLPPTYTFEGKLDALLNAGKIGRHEYDSLSALTDAGNASAHRGWVPSEEELEEMMSILTAFVQRSIMTGAVKLDPPPKPPRPPKQPKKPY